MFTLPKSYDVLVIGAGHAGVEAALAAARMGCSTLMLTQSLDTIGQMSCNPAIGGQAKGHMVREIDALGGIMGLNADATGIQFRMLNASKGPSVRSPRAQCDKKAYQFRLKAICERQPNLDLHQGNAVRILVEGDRAVGAETNFGLRIRARTVVITTGTFMRGLMHVGAENAVGGRMGDAASTLSDSLKELGFEIGRFKTGTPCRLNKRSIDFSKCEPQAGDHPPVPFTFRTWELADRGQEELFTLNRYEDGVFHVEQLDCHLTATTPKTHEIIRQNLHRSPMYSGRIEGLGPRYCPSIEDKINRFAERDRHQLFVEPEGWNTAEAYVNGFSTSLPEDVQLQALRLVPGFENCRMFRPGYAIEYDYFPPTQLKLSLETKLIKNLFFAGQINGTTGYEEAACQGLIAGINAHKVAFEENPLVLKRNEAYIGVLIDDLVNKGTDEPYRMFTSRAEFRTLLRQDNADLRLTEKSFRLGLASQERCEAVKHKKQEISQLIGLLKITKLEADEVNGYLEENSSSAINQ